MHKTKTAENEISHLSQAFADFAEQTRRLESSYLSLREEFAQTRDQLEKIVSYVSEGLIFLTPEGEVAIFNQAAQALTGYPQEEMLGSHLEEIFGLSVEELSSSGVLMLEEDCEVSINPVPGKGTLLVLRDVSELRRHQRLKEIGEMAAAMAHEIRNPLGGIEGFASLLKRDLDIPKQKEMVDAILDGTRALGRLVTSVLEYARPLDLEKERLDLVPLIQEVVNFASADADFHAKCLLKLPKTCPVMGDADHLKRALLNLLRNANEVASFIEIILDEELVIADNGPGIAQENLEKIFTPFFTTKAQGTGLGLSETHKIIEAHGGRLTVDTKEGEGTRFAIELPYVD